MENNVVQALNNLYVTYRRKFIVQKKDGSYREIKRYSKEKKSYAPVLTDKALKQHIEGKQTIGIFAGSKKTKFICFDIDTKDKARADTYQLRDTLILDFADQFGFTYEHINISFSGNKGYHIDLFFDGVIDNEGIEKFYYSVLSKAGLTTKEVELRPLAQTGIKLPLGIHQVTEKRCAFVSTYNLDETLPLNHILNIKQIDKNKFEQGLELIKDETVEVSKSVDEMTEEEHKEFVRSRVDTSLYEVNNLKGVLRDILENNTLKYPDTRNKYTFFLAIYLKEMGNDVADSISIINNIMLNTKRKLKGFISSSEQHIKYETERIVKNAHKQNYIMFTIRRDVELYKEELQDVMNIKGVHLQSLYLAMLIHAKRYSDDGESFYMAYSTMANMGSTNNRQRLAEYIQCLSDRIEVVERHEIDEFRTRREKRKTYKPNAYHIKKSFNKDSDEKILIKADVKSVDIFEILQEAYKDNVISLADVKRSLAKNTFIKFKQSL